MPPKSSVTCFSWPLSVISQPGMPQTTTKSESWQDSGSGGFSISRFSSRLFLGGREGRLPRRLEPVFRVLVDDTGFAGVGLRVVTTIRGHGFPPHGPCAVAICAQTAMKTTATSRLKPSGFAREYEFAMVNAECRPFLVPDHRQSEKI